MQCSVALLVNECPEITEVPIADRLPCGDVASVDEVWATGEIFTGELPPPIYSGRWSLASGLVTLKWPLITFSNYHSNCMLSYIFNYMFNYLF